MTLAAKVLVNYPYLVSIILFSIGVNTIVSSTNLLKKIIGINIMESAVFLLFIAMGNIKGGTPPILDLGNPQATYVNPLPSALILTGIVVSVSVTAFALGLLEKLFRQYGTLDVNRILQERGDG